MAFLEAVQLSIQKAPGANTPEVTRQLDALLDQFATAHAAEGIKVHREAYRQAEAGLERNPKPVWCAM